MCSVPGSCESTLASASRRKVAQLCVGIITDQRGRGAESATAGTEARCMASGVAAIAILVARWIVRLAFEYRRLGHDRAPVGRVGAPHATWRRGAVRGVDRRTPWRSPTPPGDLQVARSRSRELRERLADSA